MPRKTFPAVLLVLAVLALALPGKAVAGPPERASGKMAFDEVADWCRAYRREKDDDRRMALIQKLEHRKNEHDPRIAVELGETLEEMARSSQDTGGVTAAGLEAWFLLACWYVPPDQRTGEWWIANKADLRRRAKQLPQ